MAGRRFLDRYRPLVPRVPVGRGLCGDLPHTPILPPDLPQVAGHVLTIDAVGQEDKLIGHFLQLPQLPDPMSRRETAPFCSLEVNLLLCLPGEPSVLADMFAGSRQAASSLLNSLADTNRPDGIVYDKGWALRIQVRHEAVLVLEWNWEAEDGQESARALCLPRSAVTAQAIAAQCRLDHLHAALVGALGRDLWAYPARA
jgi:hypothetical protein